MTRIGEGDKKLGKLLVERGWVTGEQVLRAIRDQRAHGGRLGTCLLELEAISEERLVEILAQQQGAPAAQLEDLRYIPEEVVKLIPPRVAERCQAVPFSASERLVDVAVVDTRNVAVLDELAFCTGRRIRAHVANEARVYDALARHYGVDCPHRFRKLVDRLNRSRHLWKDDAGGPAPEESATSQVTWSDIEDALVAESNGGAPAEEEPAEGIAAKEPATEKPTAEKPAAEAPAAEKPASEAPAEKPPPALRLENVELLLRHVLDAQAAGELVLRYLAQEFPRCALLRAGDDGLTGWLGHGESLDAEKLAALRLGLREPSIFLNLARGAPEHLGPLPPMPSHRRLVQCWGAPWPAACLALPIRVRGRMGAVIYADRGAAKMADLELETWRRLAIAAGRSFERCGLDGKTSATML